MVKENIDKELMATRRTMSYQAVSRRRHQKGWNGNSGAERIITKIGEIKLQILISRYEGAEESVNLR